MGQDFLSDFIIRYQYDGACVPQNDLAAENNGYAWVTLATNDSYSLGALVLAYSLRRVNTKYELVIMVTPGVTAIMREKLAAAFSLVQEVNVLDSKDEANLALLARPELGITFTKLHCWKLTQYDKCVFVDADALVIQNCDELFEREELSAAPDVGWPDCFNSGVFVFKPSEETFASITAFAAAKGSFDGGDQGLLNMYFSDWATKDITKHLPFIYNMCSTATYSYLPAFKQFAENVKIIHFIGLTKPWLQYFDTLTCTVQPSAESGHLQSLLQLWWNIYCEHVHHQLSSDMATSTLASVWHKCTSLSYESSIPKIPITDNFTDSGNSQRPHFSEFKDPWIDYYPENPFLRNRHNNNSEEYCYGVDQFSSQVARTDHQPHRDQYYSKDHTFAPSQIYHQQHFTYDIPEENSNKGHFVHHDWYDQEQQRHIHQHFEESRQHDHYRNKDDDHHIQYQPQTAITSCNNGHQIHSMEARHENYNVCNNSYAQTDVQKINSHLSPIPIPYIVATRSEITAMERLDNANTGIAGALARLTLGQPRSAEQIALEEHIRKQSWEQGQIDYMGRDSFDNIWKKICETLSLTSKEDAQKSETLPTDEGDKAAVKTDKDPTQEQPLICKVPEEKLPLQITCEIGQKDITSTQTIEEKTPALLSESATDTLEAATKISTEPVQADICTKPIIESKDIKLCETSIEAPSPKPPTDTSMEISIEQSKLISPTTLETPLQDKSSLSETLSASLPTQDPQSSELQTSSYPLTDVVCESSVQKAGAITPVPQIDSVSVRAEVELGTLPTTQDITHSAITPVSVDSTPQQETAVSPILSETRTEDIAKLVTEPSSDVMKPLTIDPQMESEQHAELLSAAAEISTMSPVPIQVAESVLQAEPKESMLSAATAVTDEVIATTVTAVRDSTEVPLAPIVESEDVMQLSGSTCEIGKRDEVIVIADVPPSAILSKKADTATESTKEQAADLTIIKDVSSETQLATEEKTDKSMLASEISSAVGLPEKLTEPTQAATIATTVVQSEQVAGKETTEVKSPEQLMKTELAEIIMKSEEAVAKTELTETVTKTEPIEAVAKTEPTGAVAKTEPTEAVAKTESTEAAAKIEPIEAITKTEPFKTMAKAETTEAIAKSKETEIKSTEPIKQVVTEATEEAVASDESPSEVPESPSTEDPPSESSEARALNIPSTPTVIEATPPTSPSVEGAQEMETQEKIAKKSLKKSDSADGAEGDSADKKGAKKAVKKVTKKPKLKSEEASAVEGAAESSQSKTKKTVKVMKKPGTKTGQTLEAETTVPETPPPGTSDVPVPPKRKTKSTTSAKGSTGKKSESEE